MNSIFNNNITLLKTRLPHLYAAHKTSITEFLESSSCIDYPECSVIPSKSEQLTLKEQEIFLHSSYNPESEAAKAAESFDHKNKTAAVFSGFGLGYGAIAFTLQYPSKTLVLIEPDFFRVLWTLQFLDFSPVFSHPSLICLFAATHHDCISVLEHIGIHNCFFFTPTHFAMHAQQYFSSLKELIERNKQKNDINDNTLERFGSLWLKNSIKNASHIPELYTIQNVKNMYPEASAFILAAGPSLEGILPYLHEIKKKAVLICVDTALRACLNAGVEPDFIILVDPQYWNARHIDALAAPNSTLVTEIAAYPSIFRFTCKNIILASSLYPLGQYFEKTLGENGKLAAGGSVATTAWDFAHWLGIKTIFFAGLDLAYPDKKTHVKGSTFEETAIRNSHRLQNTETTNIAALFSAPSQFVQNYSQTRVLTDSRMRLYAWWFESKCAAFPQLKTYSVSLKSMHIPGIEYYPLEVFLQHKDRKHNTPPSYKVKPDGVVFKQLIDNLSETVYITSKKIHEGIQLCIQAPKYLYEIKMQNELIQKLDDLDKIIEQSQIKQIVALVFPGRKKLEELFEKFGLENESDSDFLTTIQRSKIIYSEILTGLKLLQKHLNKNS